MVRHVCGISRIEDCINSIDVTKVIQIRRLLAICLCSIKTDCCLDVTWLDESMFASCGADSLIQIMHLNESKPIKTLSFVLFFCAVLILTATAMQRP